MSLEAGSDVHDPVELEGEADLTLPETHLSVSDAQDAHSFDRQWQTRGFVCQDSSVL